jgi:hypothetical protein
METAIDGNAEETMNLLRPGQRYVRFEPITVCAAARVVELRWAGVVSAKEAAFYLRELATMDAHAGEEAFPDLVRAAQRHAAIRRSAGTAKGMIRRMTGRATATLFRWAFNPIGWQQSRGTGLAC